MQERAGVPFRAQLHRSVQHWLERGLCLAKKAGSNRSSEDNGAVLFTYFAKFGTIIRAHVKEDRSGRSRGFGFVVFSTAEAAEAAVAQRHPSWVVCLKHDMNKRDALELNPKRLRFTHNTISYCFRNGTSLDKAIQDVLDGRSKFEDFPPLEVVRKKHVRYYSLSNRRLFVAKVLASMGKLSSVKVTVLGDSRVTKMKHGRSKWERCFRTQNNGTRVSYPSMCGVCKRVHGSKFVKEEFAELRRSRRDEEEMEDLHRDCIRNFDLSLRDDFPEYFGDSDSSYGNYDGYGHDDCEPDDYDPHDYLDYEPPEDRYA